MIKINITKEQVSKNESILLQQVGIALQRYFTDENELQAIELDFEFCEGKRMFYSQNSITSNATDQNEISLLMQRIKVSSPKAKYIVDTASALFVGVPPKISTLKQEESEINKVSALNKRLQLKALERALFSVGKDASTCGHGNLLIFTKEKDDFPRFACLDPRQSAVVFDCSAEPESLFAFYFTKKRDLLENNTSKEYYYLTVYTDSYVYEIKTNSLTDYSCSFVNKTINGEVIYKMPHFFGKVPVTRFENNKESKGDAYPTYSLIDAYNLLLSSRLQNVQDIINYILVLKNVRIGDETESAKLIELLKKHHILPIEGEDVEAKFLTNPLNQEQMGTLQKTIEEQIHQISGVPNMAGESFAQNASGTALTIKLLNFIYLVNEKERNFSPALIRVIKMCVNFFEYIKNSDYIIDVNEIKINYTHNLPSNDQEAITQITNLANIGLIAPDIALRRISWIEDPIEYSKKALEYAKMKKTLDKIVSLDDKINDGTNNTNIERQNQDPKSPEARDNLNNANLGDGKDVSKDK